MNLLLKKILIKILIGKIVQVGQDLVQNFLEILKIELFKNSQSVPNSLVEVKKHKRHQIVFWETLGRASINL